MVQVMAKRRRLAAGWGASAGDMLRGGGGSSDGTEECGPPALLPAAANNQLEARNRVPCLVSLLFSTCSRRSGTRRKSLKVSLLAPCTQLILSFTRLPLCLTVSHTTPSGRRAALGSEGAQ